MHFNRIIFIGLGLGLAFSSLKGQQTSYSDGEMAFIPGGNYFPFFSGKEDQEKVDPFYIDRFPVTNREFETFLADHPQWSKKNIKSLFADAGYLKHWKQDSGFESDITMSPVVFVSWFAAQKYCECMGKRLPTTTEWELVAEAGKTRPDGRNEEGFTRLILGMASKPNPATHPEVGKTLLNYYGVWDMHGLIWEWTYDFNSALGTGGSRSDSNAENTLFCGGGSGKAKDVDDYAAFLRHALRSSLKANYTVSNVGFRCAKDADKP
ncbi:MAG: formylglycine-generating enzyme family protein [Lentimicrobium sp.]|nr:formylglycine-generating enzyme family protein [Lentimicrobium sp.]